MNYYRVHTTLAPRAYDYRPAEQPARRGWWLWVYQTLDQRARKHWAAYQAAPWLHGSWFAAAMCVHSGEGSWVANTGNGYFGGMQMDLSFQQAYGGEWLRAYGTADNWPPADQLHAAYRAWLTRGWTPWPSTAAACGLL